jgi:spermidine/putrescine transport system substrate-binding protein
MKRWIVTTSFLLCSLFLLLVWSSYSPAQDQTLNLYIWSEYIDPEIITTFEEKTGKRVVVSLYESNEDMVAKLQGGGVSQYDVVVPSDYIVPTMVELDLLQPLDKAQLPNFKNLGAKYIDLPYDPGNTYTVPYQLGTTGLGYRQDKLPENFPASWSLIFDPEQQVGPFTLIDDQRSMISSAAVYLGLNPNTTTPQELRQIQDLMLETKRRSAGFIGGVGGKNQLLSGTANVAVVYSGDTLQASQDNPNVGYLLPQEGCNIWMDTMAIPAQAPHHDLAHAFINYILEAEVGAKLSNYNRFPTPNTAALPMINEEDRNNPAIYPDDELLDKLFYSTVLTAEEQQLIDALWTNIKSG